MRLPRPKRPRNDPDEIAEAASHGVNSDTKD